MCIQQVQSTFALSDSRVLDVYASYMGRILAPRSLCNAVVKRQECLIPLPTCGVVLRCGVVGCGVVWSGVVWCGVVWYGVQRWWFVAMGVRVLVLLVVVFFFQFFGRNLTDLA